MKKRRFKNRGFTLIEVTVVVGVLALIMAIVVPNFTECRKRAIDNVCIANSVTLEKLIMVARLENLDSPGFMAWLLAPDEIESILTGSGYLDEIPDCPLGDYYAVNDLVYCDGFKGTLWQELYNIASNGYESGDYNPQEDTPGDINHDGYVDFNDVMAFPIHLLEPISERSHWED